MEAVVEAAEDVLRVLVPDCVTSLLGDYGVMMAPTHGSSAMRMMAVIGFSGRHMHGSLALAAGEEVVRRSMPCAEGCVNDWLGELANQLLGRVKNQLCRYGMDLNLAVPMVLRGLQLSVHGEVGPGGQGRVMRYEFSSAHGPVCVWFDADIEGGLMLTERESSAASAEGAVLFF